MDLAGISESLTLTLLYQKSKKNPAFLDMSPLTTWKRTFTHKHICVNSVTEIREAADAFLIWIGENRNDEGGNQAGERNGNESYTTYNHMHVHSHASTKYRHTHL